MSFESDFEMAWRPFEDKLISYIATNTAKYVLTDFEELRVFYNQTLRVWEDPSKVQYGFLSKWKSQIPGFEAAFMEIIRNFEFQEPELTKRPAGMYYAMATGITAVVGGAIGYLLPNSFFLKAHFGNVLVVIIAIFVFSIVGGGIIKSLYDAAVIKYCKNAADQYYGQIKTLYKMCFDLCKKFS